MCDCFERHNVTPHHPHRLPWTRHAHALPTRQIDAATQPEAPYEARLRDARCMRASYSAASLATLPVVCLRMSCCEHGCHRRPIYLPPSACIPPSCSSLSWPTLSFRIWVSMLASRTLQLQGRFRLSFLSPLPYPPHQVRHPRPRHVLRHEVRWVQLALNLPELNLASPFLLL